MGSKTEPVDLVKLDDQNEKLFDGSSTVILLDQVLYSVSSLSPDIDHTIVCPLSQSLRSITDVEYRSSPIEPTLLWRKKMGVLSLQLQNELG